MTLDSYKVFYITASEGQISKASKKLFVSQSAVSQSIRQLEQALEVQLFKRTPKGVELTYEGQIFYDEIDKGFYYFRKAEQVLKDIKNMEKGEIIIGAGDSVCSHYLLDEIESYHRCYPQIKIHVYNKTSAQVMVLLNEGKIDIGFVNLPMKGVDDMEVVHVKSLQDCFVCSNDYPLDVDRDHTLKSLFLNHPLILLEEGTNMRRFLEGIATKEGIEIGPAYEVGSSDLLLRFAAKRLGIAFVTREFCEREIQGNQIRVIPLKEAIEKRSIGMITQKGQKLGLAAKKFYEGLL